MLPVSWLSEEWAEDSDFSGFSTSTMEFSGATGFGGGGGGTDGRGGDVSELLRFVDFEILRGMEEEFDLERRRSDNRLTDRREEDRPWSGPSDAAEDLDGRSEEREFESRVGGGVTMGHDCRERTLDRERPAERRPSNKDRDAGSSRLEVLFPVPLLPLPVLSSVALLRRRSTNDRERCRSRRGCMEDVVGLLSLLSSWIRRRDDRPSRIVGYDDAVIHRDIAFDID